MVSGATQPPPGATSWGRAGSSGSSSRSTTGSAGRRSSLLRGDRARVAGQRAALGRSQGLAGGDPHDQQRAGTAAARAAGERRPAQRGGGSGEAQRDRRGAVRPDGGAAHQGDPRLADAARRSATPSGSSSGTDGYAPSHSSNVIRPRGPSTLGIRAPERIRLPSLHPAAAPGRHGGRGRAPATPCGTSRPSGAAPDRPGRAPGRTAPPRPGRPGPRPTSRAATGWLSIGGHQRERPDPHEVQHLLGELVELGGAQHAPRHLALGGQPLLEPLAGVVAGRHVVDADDRERHVVADAGRLPPPPAGCG